MFFLNIAIATSKGSSDLIITIIAYLLKNYYCSNTFFANSCFYFLSDSVKLWLNILGDR